MRLRTISIHLYPVRRKRGWAAHVRMGMEYGTDLFDGMDVRPQNEAEARTAARLAIAELGLEVQHIDFTVPYQRIRETAS